MDASYKDALAWIGQSSIAVLTHKMMMNFHKYLKAYDVQLLIDGHDALVGQFPTEDKDKILPEIKKCSEIAVPFSDPLYIKTGLATSTVSWGDCDDEQDWE